MGGPNGVAHLGAIQALREQGVAIDCVVGNSMGAVVGSLYASAPNADTTERLKRVYASYEKRTKAEAAEGAMVGVALGLITGGLGAALAGGAMAGAMTPVKSHARFVAALGDELGDARIESLEVPFVTMHKRTSPNGVGNVVSRQGALAAAVGMSAANQLLFPELRLDIIDPGIDDAMATPINEACRQFPDARLIAVNVHEHPPLIESSMACPYILIEPKPRSVGLESLGDPAWLKETIDVGHRATKAALTARGANW